MRPWFVALALFVSLAPAAFAGGVHGKIEGPGADGTTYTVRMVSCRPADTFRPWAIAEGLVDGKRRSVLLQLTPTAEHGVYRFTRSWPREGQWMIRLSLGHPPAPATVVTLAPNGAVESHRFYNKSDGSRECGRALRPAGAGEDDC